MKKIILAFLLSVLFIPQANALVSSVCEEDGSPCVYPWQIKVPSGNLTDNGDGTASISDQTGGVAGNHTLDSATHTDVNSITEAKGKLLVNAGVNWDALPLGIEGFPLVVKNADTLGMNWSSLKAVGINWDDINIADKIGVGGINWDNIPNFGTDKVLQGIATNTANWQSITAYESALEGVMDLEDMQGAVTDGQVPDTITASNYQPLDSDLTTIAGLTATSNNFLQSVSSAWASRTPAQVQSSLSIDDLITLSGVSEGAAHLGTFTGTTISDNGTIKAGMQELETGLETKVTGPASATDAVPVLFDGTTGKLVKNSTPTGTGNPVLATSPTLTTPDITLQDGNGAAPTTDGQIKYDRTTERLQVGDGSTTSEFVKVGTLTDTKACIWDSASKSIVCNSSGGSDTNAVKEFFFPAVAMLPVEPADGIPPITKTANTNIDTLTVSYNDSADECRTAVIQVPSDVQSGSTVTFRWKWFSLTATSGSVVWDVRYQSTGAEGESADGTTTIKAAASDAVQGTVKQYTTTTVTETLATLGWAASDTINLLVCRDGNGTAGTDDMTGDAELYTFSTEIPRA